MVCQHIEASLGETTQRPDNRHPKEMHATYDRSIIFRLKCFLNE